MADKLDLPFHLLSDPRGELIKLCDLWNDEEGVSEPVIVALDRSGTIQLNVADRRLPMLLLGAVVVQQAHNTLRAYKDEEEAEHGDRKPIVAQ
jgi:hypothetical protein